VKQQPSQLNSQVDKVKACEQAYRILDDVTVGAELPVPSLPISAATANDPPRKKKTNANANKRNVSAFQSTLKEISSILIHSQ